MSAQAALSVVSQIQLLANGPKTTDMRAHLGQVASSLQFFLVHPDSRVRIGSAKTLVQLAGNYADDMKHLDLSKIQSAIVTAEERKADGSDPCASEQLQLLSQAMALIEGKKAPAVVDVSTPTASPDAASRDTRSNEVDKDVPSQPSVGVQRGEVVLKVAAGDDKKAQVSVLQAVVAVPGVVSVTVEGPHVVVNTRTAADAEDPGFHRDLLTAIEAQGLSCVTIVQNACASSGQTFSRQSSADASRGAPDNVVLEEEELDEPGYLDDDEEEDCDEADAAADAARTGGSSSTSPAVAGSATNATSFQFSSAFGAPGVRPGGLGAGGAGAAPWSFYSQANWMTGRRVLEFDSDPTMAARLQKAKARRAQEELDQQTRLGSVVGKLTSWWG